MRFTPNAAGGYDSRYTRDTAGPACTITYPLDGSTMLGGLPMTVTATVSDSIGVQRVHFQSSIFGLNRYVFEAPYEAAFTPPVSGTVKFTLTTLDFAGNQGTCVSTVTLTTPPLPAVTIASPADGARLLAGKTMRVRVDASSPIGMNAVDLVVNGTTLSTLFTAPYEFPLIVPAGMTSLRIRAVGRDSSNRPASSAEVTVGIDADPLTTVQGRVTDANGSTVRALPRTCMASPPRCSTSPRP
jgi:hypothetical protein